MANCCTPNDDAQLMTLLADLESIARDHAIRMHPLAPELLQRAARMLREQRGELQHLQQWGDDTYRALDHARNLGPLRKYVEDFTRTLRQEIGTTHYSLADDSPLVPIRDQLAATGPGGRVLVRMLIELAVAMMQPGPSVDAGAQWTTLHPQTFSAPPEGWAWHLSDMTVAHPQRRETLVLQLRELPPGVGIIAYDAALELHVYRPGGSPPPGHLEIVRTANASVIGELELARVKDAAP